MRKGRKKDEDCEGFENGMALTNSKDISRIFPTGGTRGLTNSELRRALDVINDEIDEVKEEWKHLVLELPKNPPTQELAKVRTNRAIQGTDLLWGRLLGPKSTTPWPPEWGLDKEAIELAQAGRTKLLDTLEGGSVYMARSAARQSYRYQKRNGDDEATGYGSDYLLARINYENVTASRYDKKRSVMYSRK